MLDDDSDKVLPIATPAADAILLAYLIHDIAKQSGDKQHFL